MSATYLSKAVQILVRPKYAADSNTGTSPEDKISSLALAAAQDVFLSIFGLTMPS